MEISQQIRSDGPLVSGVFRYTGKWICDLSHHFELCLGGVSFWGKDPSQGMSLIEMRPSYVRRGKRQEGDRKSPPPRGPGVRGVEQDVVYQCSLYMYSVASTITRRVGLSLTLSS